MNKNIKKAIYHMIPVMIIATLEPAQSSSPPPHSVAAAPVRDVNDYMNSIYKNMTALELLIEAPGPIGQAARDAMYVSLHSKDPHAQEIRDTFQSIFNGRVGVEYRILLILEQAIRAANQNKNIVADTILAQDELINNMESYELDRVMNSSPFAESMLRDYPVAPTFSQIRGACARYMHRFPSLNTIFDIQRPLNLLAAQRKPGHIFPLKLLLAVVQEVSSIPEIASRPDFEQVLTKIIADSVYGTLEDTGAPSVDVTYQKVKQNIDLAAFQTPFRVRPNPAVGPEQLSDDVPTLQAEIRRLQAELQTANRRLGSAKFKKRQFRQQMENVAEKAKSARWARDTGY
ncbi:MAG: hypothetical protein LBJ92_02765 [Holosporales bacterium]|jgi:hypothetical protein|nr:hypothetical protein [Holosporales bacterium]